MPWRIPSVPALPVLLWIKSISHRACRARFIMTRLSLPVPTSSAPSVGRLYQWPGISSQPGGSFPFPRNTAAREVADWSSIGHCLIFAGSLAPLPIVDGGSILKWTLVESGKDPQEADQAVEKAGIAAGLAAGAAGLAFAARRRWLPAAGLLAAGVIAVAAARGKIR